MTRRNLILLGFFSAAVLVAGFAHLFRTETLDNPDLGVIQFRFRWGYAVEISIDSNRDGRTDGRTLLDTSNARYGDRELPTSEIWEDRDFDGKFEIHAYVSDGRVSRVEIDGNGDGEPEEIYSGKEAASFFLRFVHSDKSG